MVFTNATLTHLSLFLDNDGVPSWACCTHGHLLVFWHKILNIHITLSLSVRTFR